MIDLHNDFLTKLNDDDIVKYLETNQNLLDLICCPVFTTELKNPLKFIKNAKKTIKNYNFCKISIEDIGFLKQKNFFEILKIKPIYISLTWNYKNKFAGGAYSDGRLTEYGKVMIRKCEENNILIDCAHLNYRSFSDILDISKRPVICSHTGFCDIVWDKRNLTRHQIKDLIDNKGIIGLYFVGKYISKERINAYDIIKNIDYFVQNFGVDNLCFGTDFFGTDDLPKKITQYKDMELIKRLLVKCGYTHLDINKIFKTNAERFFQKYSY